MTCAIFLLFHRICGYLLPIGLLGLLYTYVMSFSERAKSFDELLCHREKKNVEKFFLEPMANTINNTNLTISNETLKLLWFVLPSLRGNIEHQMHQHPYRMSPIVRIAPFWFQTDFLSPFFLLCIVNWSIIRFNQLNIEYALDSMIHYNQLFTIRIRSPRLLWSSVCALVFFSSSSSFYFVYFISRIGFQFGWKLETEIN